MTADEIKQLLQLEPLRMEGGFFRETYRSRWMVSPDYLPEGMQGMHSIGTAIYFLITPESYSRLHRLPGSEIFHFYLGDPVEMLQLWPDGTTRTEILGSDLAAGMHVQLHVPKHVWQGSRLLSGGSFALLGCTVSPGFDYADYETGKRDVLLQEYPQAEATIRALTHA